MSTKGSSSKQTTQSGTAQQRTSTDKAIQFFEPLAYGAGDPMAGFEGDRLAALSGLQSSALNLAQGFTDAFSPYRDIPLYGEGTDALRGILAGQTGAATMGPDAVSNYFAQAIRTPAQKAFQEDTLPQIRESFAGPGFWNKDRMVQEVKAQQDLQDSLMAQEAGLQFNVLQQNQAIEEAKAGRALSGIGALQNFAQLPTQEQMGRLGGIQSLFGLGSAEQQQQQAELNLALQEFQEANRDFDPETLNVLMQLLNVGSTGIGSSSSSGAGLGNQLLGLGGSLALGGLMTKYVPGVSTYVGAK